MASIHELKSKEQLTDFIKQNNKCLVEFASTGCHKCKAVQEELKGLEKSSSHAKFATINAQESEEVIEQYNIVGFPTVICFKDGKEVARTSSEDKGKLKECLGKLG